MTITVSIIIATFNASKTLRVALNSVKNQTFQQWECIVVDGASNDNTLEIIQQYAIEDSRFRFISEPDNGIYDAMNKGWKMASGAWILYLGGDDELELTGIESLIKKSNGFDLVYGNTTLLFPSGKIKKQYSRRHHVITRRSFACHQSIIVKKKVIEEIKGFDTDYPIIADYDLILRIYLNNYKFRNVTSFITIFYAGGTSSDHLKVLKERFKIHKKNKIRMRYIFYIVAYTKSVLLLCKNKFTERNTK